MASMDDEFARFTAELATLEQVSDSDKAKVKSLVNDTNETQKPTQKATAEAETSKVKILPPPKVYAAPPRILTRGSSNTYNSSGSADLISQYGALSGFPAGITGEMASISGTAQANAARQLYPRMNMITGQFLSTEEQQMMNTQQSVYDYDPLKAKYSTSTKGNANKQSNVVSHRPKIIRMAGGERWEDKTLAEWPTNDFRLFCGDLGNEVTDELLMHTFSRFPSFQRAKVVRDKYTHKSRGYGFLSFLDPFDCAKALREMNGKYIGNRPVKLCKSKWEERNEENAKKKMRKKRRTKAHVF